MKKLVIRMVSGKEHTLRDSDEMIESHIADIIQGGRYIMSTGISRIFINEIEEYRVEVDVGNMS